MPRFTPVYGGGRYSYGPDAYGYGGYSGYDGYSGYGRYSRYPAYGPGYSGEGYYDDQALDYGRYPDYGPEFGYADDGRGPGGFTFYDDMALDQRPREGRGYSYRPETLIIEREPEFAVDDEKLIGGSRARLPQRLLRCASIGSLVERETPPAQWQRRVQVDRCKQLPWKRDANQCDAVQAAPPRQLQRRVGWQQFEDAVVKSLGEALRKTEVPPPVENKVVVMQGAQPPAGAGQKTIVTQQQQPKKQKYTITVVNPQQGVSGAPQVVRAPPTVAAQQAPQFVPAAPPLQPAVANAGFVQAQRPVVIASGAPIQPQMVVAAPQVMSQAPVSQLTSLPGRLQSVPQSVGRSQPVIVAATPAGTANRTVASSRIISRS